jgi:hypothetical protein
MAAPEDQHHVGGGEVGRQLQRRQGAGRGVVPSYAALGRSQFNFKLLNKIIKNVFQICDKLAR